MSANSTWSWIFLMICGVLFIPPPTAEAVSTAIISLRSACATAVVKPTFIKVEGRSIFEANFYDRETIFSRILSSRNGIFEYRRRHLHTCAMRSEARLHSSSSVRSERTECDRLDGLVLGSGSRIPRTPCKQREAASTSGILS